MKKGQTLSMFTLIEVLLCIVVLLGLMFAVNTMAGKTSFFYSFFAKDNAHLVEALHAVPNGEAHFAYLLSNDNYRVGLTDEKVTIQGANVREEKGKIIGGSRKEKAFGKSRGTTVVPEDFFVPHYYQYVYTPGQARSIVIQQNFKDELSCWPSPVELTGITVTGSADIFDKEVGEVVAARILSGAQQAAAGERIELSEGRPRIYVYLTQSESNEVAVYYSRSDSLTARLSCLIAKHTSIGKNTRYEPIQNAPEKLLNVDADIIIYMQLPQESGAEAVKNSIVDAIKEYWGGTRD